MEQNGKVAIGQSYVLEEYKLTVADMTDELILLRAYTKQLEKQLKEANQHIETLLNEKQEQ